MATFDEIMNEKTDLEGLSQEHVNPEILNPLLFLLASRRGVRNDTRFAETSVSDDYIMRFQGLSGVKAINTKPLWKRIIFSLGISSGKFFLVFFVFNFVQISANIIDHYSGDDAYERARFWSRSKLAGYTALLTIFLLIAAERYARRLAAAATPPQYDPTSYQYRLISAMEQSGIEYREVLATPPDEMMKYWKEAQALCERFRIVGLVDPEHANHVYDLVVRFYNNGGLLLQFPATDPTTKNPMVSMSPNTSSS